MNRTYISCLRSFRTQRVNLIKENNARWRIFCTLEHLTDSFLTFTNILKKCKEIKIQKNLKYKWLTINSNRTHRGTVRVIIKFEFPRKEVNGAVVVYLWLVHPVAMLARIFFIKPLKNPNRRFERNANLDIFENKIQIYQTSFSTLRPLLIFREYRQRRDVCNDSRKLKN